MKFKLPKLGLPKLSLPKLSLPKIGLPGKRQLLIAASALALLGAGGVAFFFVRPMLAHKASVEAAAGADKPAQAPQDDAAKTQEAKDGSGDRPKDAPKDKSAEEPKKDGAAEVQKLAASKPEATKAGDPQGEVAKENGAKAQEAKPDSKTEAKPDSKPEAKPQEKADEKAEAKPEGKEEKAQEKGEKGEKPEKAGKEEKLAAPLPLPPPPSEVERLIRRLQDIQERVATGDAAAYVEMPRLLHMMGQKFADEPPETWSTKGNARALVLFLLSGGGSTLGRTVLGQHRFAPSEEHLAKAAVAYLEGVEGADREYMLSLDPRELDLDLGAQIAFVQSILQTGTDRPKAIASLDLARLLAPGGLVEEAALRREVALLSETSAFDKFAELARQYWQRFHRSPYADNFLRQFIAAAARISLLIKPSEWAQLEEFISSLTPETRLKLYLVMSQASAVSGNIGFAEMAAQRAADLAAEGSVERQRALLYRAAARVGAADSLLGPKLLVDVARDKLPAADQPLYDAVTTTSARIYRDPEGSFDAPPPRAPNAAPNAIDASLARAEKGVSDADSVMDSVTKTMERKTR